MRSAVDDVDLVQGYRMNDLFSYLKFALRTLNKFGLQKRNDGAK